MNEVIQGLLSRRSVRLYMKEQIRDKELKTILECGLYAPSGGGLQKARFLVIQDPKRMELLNDTIRYELSSREITGESPMNRGIRRAKMDHYQFLYEAPTLIAAVAPNDWENAMADCACAIENIWLAATAIGLGACWSNQPRWLTDIPAVREIFYEAGLRENEDIYGSIGVGYPGHVAKTAAPRKPDRISLDIPREL